MNVFMSQLLKSLPVRSTAILGPFDTDKLLWIKKVGNANEGEVHQLEAPVIYDYTNRQNKLVEVVTLPNVFLMEKCKAYLLSTFVSSVEYQISEV